MTTSTIYFTGFMKKWFIRYSDWNYNQPYKSTIINSAVVMTTGDFLLQQYDRFIHKSKEIKYDFQRTLTVFMFGTFYQGPTYALWYRHILPYIAPITEGAAKSQLAFQLAKKVFYDETINSWAQTGAYLTFQTYVQTQSLSECKEKVQKDFMRIWKTDLACWPFIQLVTFSFIPLHMQALTTNLCGVFWSAYLSHVQFM